MPRGNPIPPAAAIDLLERVEAARLPTFLFGGTLLGAVREGRILADDWDVDVAMLVEHWDATALDRLGAVLDIGLVRRWGPQTPWAMGSIVDEAWRDAPSLAKLERGEHHVDLHILAPGLDPAWRYWQRGPSDHQLMRTPAALLAHTAPVMVEGRPMAAPLAASQLLSYCYGQDWRERVPAAEWYASDEFRRIHAERTVSAPVPVAVAS